MVEKMSSRGNVVGGMSCQGILFQGSVRSGTVFRESSSLGSVHEEVLDGKMSRYQFISDSFSEELR